MNWLPSKRGRHDRVGVSRCGRKRLSTGPCIKQKGHVGNGDPRHTDGKYSWGGYA